MPLAAPVAIGAKATVIAQRSDGARVPLQVFALLEKPLPVTVVAEKLAGSEPLLITVNTCVVEEPTAWVPNPKLGLSETDSSAGAAPTPDSATLAPPTVRV